tara:strand:- start:10433 stop:11884 length:1452 start_codon:yes stop_codon:yes gene_type:complete
MTTDKLLGILITSVLTTIFLISVSQKVKATETTNLLNNGSFDNQTEGWELDGTASYDGNNYGDINKSVRFSGIEGGSVTQDISLGNINTEQKYIDKVNGSIVSIGCNNEGSNWCTTTGTASNLDPVNTTITISDGTQSEVLTHNITSDYNDGVITSTFTLDVNKDFNVDNTNITINVYGHDTGDKVGKFGSIIDDLSLTLTLTNPVVAQPIEVPDIVQIEAPIAIVVPEVVQPVIIEPVPIEIAPVEPVVVEKVQIGSLDATSIANTISTGVIEISPPQENLLVADIATNNIINVGADVPVEMDIPSIELPEINVEMDMEIEPVNEPEPETLEEIRSEEIPAEVEETTMEEDLEIEVKQPEETKGESNELQKETSKEEESKKEEEKHRVHNKKNVLDKPVSDVKVQTVDVPTIVSFDKGYFKNTYKDTIDLTTTEIDFYEQDGFNNQDYAQASAAFFDWAGNANGQWSVANSRPVIKIEQFRR